MSDEKEQKEHEHPPEHHEFNIQIDRVHYKVKQAVMTGLQLRHVPPTPIGPDRDLFEVGGSPISYFSRSGDLWGSRSSGEAL